MPTVVNAKTFTYADKDFLPDENYVVTDGERRDMLPTGFEHGYLEGIFCELLKNHFRDKGYVATGEVGILIGKEPLRLRAADVVYIGKDKSPGKPRGILTLAPDLIVEIVSESNTLWEMNDKVKDYLSIAVGRIVIVDPQTETLTVYQHGKRESAIYNFAEEFKLADGLKVKLTDLLR